MARRWVTVDSANPRLPDQVAEATLAYVDPIWHGAAADGVTDDTSALQAAVAACGEAGRLVLNGTYAFSGLITIPRGVDVVGPSKGRSSSSYGKAILKAIHADARLAFGERLPADAEQQGGISGNFEVDGNNIATQPLYIGWNVARTFQSIRVDRAAGNPLVVESAQNCVFVRIHCANSTGSVKIDSGAGGNVFVALGISACGSSTAPSLHIDESYGTGPYPVPQHNLFLHPVIERPDNGQTDLVMFDAGNNNVFITPIFSTALATAAINNLNIASGVGTLRIDNPTFSGDTTYSTGLRAGTGHGAVSIDGLATMLSLLVGFEITGSARIDIGSVDFASVTTKVNGASAWAAMRTRTIAPVEITRYATGDTAWRAHVDGDTVARALCQANGLLLWSDGSTAADTNLFRHIANQLRTNDLFIADLGVRIGTGAATEPTWTRGTGTPEGAVTAGVGSLFSRTDGGAGTVLYVKESGTGNTGWVAK